MARRKEVPGRGGRWVAGAAFVVAFVLLGEIVKGDRGRLVAAVILSLAAVAYLVGLFLLGREGGAGGRILRDFLALGGAFTVLVSYTPVAEYLAGPLLVRPDLDRADAIVVLGGGLYPNGTLTASSLERTLYAVGLYRRGLSPRLIFSGGVTGEAPRPEAEVMAELARFVGVPGAAILLERTSRNTYENAVEVAGMLRGEGYRRVLLVAGATHMYRAQLAFRRQMVQVLPAPVRTRESLRYVPGGRWNLFFDVLHEYGGLAYYKVRGRI